MLVALAEMLSNQPFRARLAIPVVHLAGLVEITTLIESFHQNDLGFVPVVFSFATASSCTGARQRSNWVRAVRPWFHRCLITVCWRSDRTSATGPAKRPQACGMLNHPVMCATSASSRFH